jgi:virginiamycin B lyase
MHGSSLLSVLCCLLALVGGWHASATAVTSRPVKAVVEYSLPAAAETHEILVVNDNLLVISQQTNGALLKVALDGNGEPLGVRSWTATNEWSGLHGLALDQDTQGNESTPTVWATVQFDNAVLQIDPNGSDIDAQPQIIRTIPIPAPAHGPHGILVNKGNLWLACKDSSHVVRISIANPDDHQVWAVSGRPIFVAVHPSTGDVFSGLDLSSKIWHYKNDGGSGEEIAIPPEKGTTPVGLIAGPDGNAWVVLLGNATTGMGTFGRINGDASIDWFSMSSSIGSTAPLIHLAFDQNPSRFWLLGSSTVCPSCVNAVFTVQMDDLGQNSSSVPRVAVQNTIMLPTQRSWTHRMISHRGSLYITELTTSTLAHVSGVAVQGLDVSETWDQYAGSGLGTKAVEIRYNNTPFE